MKQNSINLSNSIFSFWNREVSKEETIYGIHKTLSSYLDGSGLKFIGRIIWSLTIVYFCGVLQGILIYFTYATLSKLLNELTLEVKENFEKKIITPEQAAACLYANPLLRGILNFVIFITLLYSPSEYSAEAAIFFYGGQVFVVAFQSANLRYLLKTALIPSLSLLFIMAVGQALYFSTIAPLITPAFFIFSTIIYSGLNYIDNLKSINFEIDIANKTNDLESEIAKREAEQVLRQQIEKTAGVGTFSMYFDNRYAIWSKGTFKALGYNENGKIPSKIDFINNIAEGDKRLFINAINDTRKFGLKVQETFRYKAQSGEYRQIKFYSAPIVDENGNIIGMEGLVIDQTQIMNASNKLENTQKLLNLALETGNAVVFTKDIDSDKMESFGKVSIFGVNSELKDAELFNSVFANVTEEDSKLVIANIDLAIQTNERQTFEHPIYLPDGRINVVSSAMSLEVNNDGSRILISIARDITEEAKRRAELAEAVATAESASRVKSEFLANMSHEIRTPLNGVIAVAGVLAKTELSEDQTEMVKLIEGSGQSLSTILNDILDIARVESGKLQIESIAFSLNDVLKGVSSLFGVKAEEKGLGFNIEAIGNDTDRYIGDPTRIRQILCNFLSNSIKFTKYGSVSLRTSIVSDEYSMNKANAKFEIIDTGSGISQEALARLFSRFEQVDGSITREHGGSGLGLSICKALAELMDGRVYASSIIGEGSIFTLEIPLELDISTQCENTDTSILADEDFEDVSELNILAADDNATNRKVLEMILLPMGINLVLVENGQEALENFKQAAFDIVLMDLQMPVLDGLSATKLIREFEEAEGRTRTPIIALSANAMAHHIKEANDAGADMHVAKPFTPQGLVDGIEQALALKDSFEMSDNQAVSQ